MSPTNGLAFGLVIGIIMIWMSVLVALASRPLAKGEAHSREYNYRPWQPKFVSSLTDEEADMINKRFAKYAIDWALLTIGFGILAIIFGLIPSLNDFILGAFAIPFAAMVIIIFFAYYLTYKVAQRKAAGRN